MSYIVGLTGGIASGKSTVSDYLLEKKIPIVDADVIAREAVEPGTSGLTRIITTFGTTYLLPDGTLNRKKLGELIFNDEDSRKQLGDILDQEIFERMQYATDSIKSEEPLIVWDVALLLEKGYQRYVDQVVLVSVDPQIQLQRLMVRDKISKEEAQQKIATQWSLADKAALADIVIDNNGSTSQTYRQIDDWLKTLKERM